MAEVLPWQTSADPRATLDRAIQALDAGQLVAFPTETSYVLTARADVPAAVAALRQHSPAGTPLTLAVGNSAGTLALLPELGRMARRLARRCWPGPVTLQVTGNTPESVARLPEALQEQVAAEGHLALRCPAHSAILHALYQMKVPLVLAEFPSAVTAEQAAQALGVDVALLIDDGPCRFHQGQTVVRAGDHWELLREGAVGRAEMQVQAACLVVFVCTGNTCRSPLAEVLCKKKLCERLNCEPAELPQRGFVILSAGVAAYDGDEAAGSAVEIAREYGADLSSHLSKSLDQYLTVQADYLVCMTRSHLQALVSLYPGLGCEPRLLSPTGVDLPDPVGQEEGVYRTCAGQIWQDLDTLLEELVGAPGARNS